MRAPSTSLWSRRLRSHNRAVAASMLTAIYHMLKDGTLHQDLGADHFDRRSTEVKAKRLVAQLTKLGFQVELQPLPKAA